MDDAEPRALPWADLLRAFQAKMRFAMFGTTKLSTIRKVLQKAYPIAELDRRIAAAKMRGERTEIMEGLKRFLERAPKPKPGKHGAGE